MCAAPAVEGQGGPLLRVTGVLHRFGGREALRGLAFEAAEGEVFGLLGRNGSGKSTVLGLIAQTLGLQRGVIEYEGAPLGRVGRRLRMDLGMVFQNPSIDQKLTCLDNLLLYAQMYGLPRALGRDRAVQLLNIFGLAGRAGSLAGTLSGGMRRKLDLARALLHQPKLLIMDEPTTGLDEAAFRDFWAQIRGIRSRQKLTVVVATHRAAEAELCDRVAIIQEGRTLCIETPDALLEAVGGDVITMTTGDVPLVAAALRERLEIPVMEGAGEIQVTVPRGHELIPRLVEAVPKGILAAVTLRRPSLADAFVKLTGAALDGAVSGFEARAAGHD